MCLIVRAPFSLVNALRLLLFLIDKREEETNLIERAQQLSR